MRDVWWETDGTSGEAGLAMRSDLNFHDCDVAIGQSPQRAGGMMFGGRAENEPWIYHS